MLLVGRDIHEIPGPHFQHPVLELEPGSPLEHQHPLGLILVVPEARRRAMAVGDDSLDADALAGPKNRGEFLWEFFRNRREEVRRHWGWDFDNNKP